MTYGFTARQVRQKKCHATERLTKGWQRKLCEMRERLPMQIKGTVYKDGKFWLIEFPLLNAMTQGRTRKEALVMGADWVESDIDTPGFKAEVVHAGNGIVSLTCNDDTALLALVLRRLRQQSGLSLIQAGERLGNRSPNAYGRYEQGKASPTMAKLNELVRAVAPDRELTLSI